MSNTNFFPKKSKLFSKISKKNDNFLKRIFEKKDNVKNQLCVKKLHFKTFGHYFSENKIFVNLSMSVWIQLFFIKFIGP